MTVGRLLGNIANVLQGSYGFTINHWNVMEVTCGFVGGFLYCFGMVDREYPEPPEGKNIPLASSYGILFVLGLLPLWHRLARIRPSAKLKEWAASFKSYGHDDPEGTARTVLWLIDGVCVLGFVGAAIWLWVHFKRRQRLAMLPVLWLSGTMLLFQNVNALYFYDPRVPDRINMHNVFWVLFGLMALYAAVARPRPATVPSGAGMDAEGERRFPWAGWVAGTIVALAMIVFLAGYVNGERTMASANTRWPLWQWRDGPFPGRAAKP